MEVNKRYLWLVAFQLVWFTCLVESYPDGVNFYKGPYILTHRDTHLHRVTDWLRNKNEEDVERMIAEDQFEAPRLCKTPSSFTDLGMGEPLEKRTVNRYKNMMLTKDSLDAPLIDDAEQTKEATRFYFPRITPKRSPGAILSWAIPAANRV
uniref:Uncharacterized protein n=1 Tax=Anopheles christyi TaxID=43041 RepID=A0A182JU16_9DIPT